MKKLYKFKLRFDGEDILKPDEQEMEYFTLDEYEIAFLDSFLNNFNKDYVYALKGKENLLDKNKLDDIYCKLHSWCPMLNDIYYYTHKTLSFEDLYFESLNNEFCEDFLDRIYDLFKIDLSFITEYNDEVYDFLYYISDVKVDLLPDETIILTKEEAVKLFKEKLNMTVLFKD